MQTMALPTTSRAAVGIIIIRELRYYWTVNRLLFTLMKKMEYVLLISRDGNHQISEIKEISETDAQSLMLKNNPIGEDYTSQE